VHTRLRMRVKCFAVFLLVLERESPAKALSCPRITNLRDLRPGPGCKPAFVFAIRIPLNNRRHRIAIGAHVARPGAAGERGIVKAQKLQNFSSQRRGEMYSRHIAVAGGTENGALSFHFPALANSTRATREGECFFRKAPLTEAKLQQAVPG